MEQYVCDIHWLSLCFRQGSDSEEASYLNRYNSVIVNRLIQIKFNKKCCNVVRFTLCISSKHNYVKMLNVGKQNLFS